MSGVAMTGRVGVAAFAVALLVTACGGGGVDRAAAVGATVDEVVVPAHARLADTTATLAEEVTSLCAQPSEEQLGAARDAWREAAAARAAERPVAVGPAMDRSSKAELDWQADPERVDELLAGDRPVTPDAVATTASGARGLSATELLLFGDGADALATAEGERRCRYAASASTLVAAEASRLRDELAEGAADTLAGRGGVAMTADGAIDELVNTQVNTLDDLVDGRLAPDAGAEPGGGPAAAGLATARAQLATMAALYEPQRLGGALPEPTRDSVRATIEEAVAALDGDGDGLPTSESPERAELYAAVDRARVAVRTDAVSALDVVLTFSDNDGDSG